MYTGQSIRPRKEEPGNGTISILHSGYGEGTRDDGRGDEEESGEGKEDGIRLLLGFWIYGGARN